MSSFEIIDSHVHYWQAASVDRPWDSNALSPAPEPLSVEKILATAHEAGVQRVVQVVPSLMGYDNRYALEGAEAYQDEVLGVFARINPLAPDLAVQLGALRKHPKFLGIRVALLTPLQKTWFFDATLKPLFDEAARLGFPIAIYAKGYAREIGALARQHPATRFLVDHLAMDNRRAHPFEEWSDLLALADLPNVWIKASFLPEASHEEPYPYRRGQQYLLELVGTFGAARIIWGTNYPPSIHACSYRQSVEFMKQACGSLPQADQAKIFAGTLLDVCS